MFHFQIGFILPRFQRRVYSQDVIPGRGCHVRTCDQTITGRNLDYSTALQIIQNEEYLTAADLSVIRKKREVAFGNESIASRVSRVFKS